MELQVFSTVAGKLPLMVKNQEAACFVPYEQAKHWHDLAHEYQKLLDEAVEMVRILQTEKANKQEP